VFPKEIEFNGESICRSCSTRIETGCGHLFVIIDYHEKKVKRVQANLGKQGSCTRCQNDALSRVISVGLDYGVPLDAFIRELKGHQCEKPKDWPKNNRVLSCPDGVAKALEEVTNVIQIQV